MNYPTGHNNLGHVISLIAARMNDPLDGAIDVDADTVNRETGIGAQDEDGEETDEFLNPRFAMSTKENEIASNLHLQSMVLPQNHLSLTGRRDRRTIVFWAQC